MADARVAVITITRNRCAELLRNLERLRRLPEGPRIVVVDNGSTDGTADAVRRAFPDVEVLRLPDNIGAGGRNLALRMIDEPYAAFADDDTWWEPGGLSLAADVLDAHRRIAVVTGRLLDPRGDEDVVCTEMADSPLPLEPELPGRPLVSFLAGASVVRKSAFLSIGGFDQRWLVGGEEELPAIDLQSAGWALRYIPEMVVHHESSTMRDPHRRRRRGIRNTLWVTWLRRPLRSALRRTVLVLSRKVQRDRVSVLGVLDALRGLPWVVRERRVVPPHVEQRLRLMDGPQLESRVRRYVS